MSKVTKVYSREILDSRGNPTIETAVFYEGGFAVSSIPSGASTGTYEALELRDNDHTRFNGKGVKKAVENVNTILGPAIVNMDLNNQRAIDEKLIMLDATPNKSNLGANSILSISQAVFKAASFSQRIPMYVWANQLCANEGIKENVKVPTPILNVINGGKHGAGNLDFQEFHIIGSSNKTFAQALRMGTEIYHKIKDVLKYRNAISAVGDEGGFAPNLFTNLDALEVIVEGIKQSSYQFQHDVFLGLDLAPAFFYKNGEYHIKDLQESLNAARFIEYIENLHKEYHLLYLEDPLNEDAWDDWAKLTRDIGHEVYIIGDDLLATNIERLKKAISLKAVNTILIKPNQIGTVTETLQVIKTAKMNNIKTIVSHRSGETTDYFIADFAVGVASDFVKFGAPARGERVVKYNRLLAIDYELNNNLL